MNFKEFKRRFQEECERHEKENLNTPAGFFSRLISLEKYSDSYIEREESIARYAKGWIPQLIKNGELSSQNLSLYKAALEGTNTSLKKRIDFIITITTGISVVGLTDLNSFFTPTLEAPPKWFLAAIASIIILALIEVIKVQRKIASNEKLARVIGVCI